MIRLIASDIDGTLVKDGSHEIDPAYYDVIRELKEAGITFCACSGRQYHSMLELFAPVADDIFFISANGTLVRTKERILHSWKIEPETYFDLLKRVRRIEGAEIVVEGPDVCWIEEKHTASTRLLRDSYHYAIVTVPDVAAIPTDQIIKVTLYHPDVETATKEFVESYQSKDLLMTISGVEWLDIVSAKAGKGEAYALLQKHLGIKVEETVYFGDNMNDLSAFREAGIAATVANARSEVQAAADIVAKSYSDLGVLEELRHFLDLSRRFQAEQ